jgi:hypothetical protein
MSNVVNKRWTYSRPDHAIGNPEDEPALNVTEAQTLISLLKALLLNTQPETIAARVSQLEARMAALEQRVTTLENA